jgi:hypothetical protein
MLIRVLLAVPTHPILHVPDVKHRVEGVRPAREVGDGGARVNSWPWRGAGVPASVAPR